ncbi:MAG: hypothetical protein P4L35_18320, partial [Ignavibacteriaceae bacterium]|nr:hypothetical protein [Ignavibacteriaceae bacterium]
LVTQNAVNLPERWQEHAGSLPGMSLPDASWVFCIRLPPPDMHPISSASRSLIDSNILTFATLFLN